MGTLKPLRHRTDMRRRTGLLAIALTAALLAAGAPARAAEECSFSTGGAFDISGGRATY